MLSFEHKLSVLRTFKELREESISNNRVNFVYGNSKKRGKVVVRELHRSGNRNVCGRYMSGYPTDSRGWMNIKYLNESQLREVVRKSIESVSR